MWQSVLLKRSATGGWTSSSLPGVRFLCRRQRADFPPLPTKPTSLQASKQPTTSPFKQPKPHPKPSHPNQPTGEAGTRCPSRGHSCTAGIRQKPDRPTSRFFCAAHGKSEPACEDASPPTSVHHHHEICATIEFWCPCPKSSDATSPVCPSRHHKAGYGRLPLGLQGAHHNHRPSRYRFHTIPH